jgi:PAS domain S-box-containing protein
VPDKDPTAEDDAGAECQVRTINIENPASGAGGENGGFGFAQAPMPPHGLSYVRSRPAHQYLFAFAAALLIPVLIFASLLGWQYVRSERDRATERTGAAVRELTTAIERELAGPEMTLRTLTTNPFLVEGDLERFYPRAKNAADALGMTIVVREPGAKSQLLNTAVPWGTPLDGGSPKIPGYEALSIKTGKTVATGVVTDPISRKPVIVIMAPVYRDDRAVFVLSIGIDTERFAKVLGQVALPEGWFSLLTDQTGLIIARSVAHEQFTGRPAVRDWYQSATRSDGMWRGQNLEGNEVLFRHARSAKTGWIVAVSVTSAVLNAPLWQTLSLLLSFGAILLLIAVVLAFWLGGRLANAIQSLKQAAMRQPSEQGDAPVATPVSEINEVGAVMQETFSQNEQRLAQMNSVLATVPSAMVVIDRKGIVQTFSRSAEKVFGYSAAEVVGGNVSMLMPEPERSMHDGHIERYLRTGEKRIIGIGRIVTAMKKDGTKFPVELHVGQAGMADGRLFTAFIHDQTEKQRIEQELRQTQKMEAIGKLTGGVAHDFNNLLTVIKGNLEMLEDVVSEDDRDLVRDSQEAADLAAQLTASLLAFGRRMPLNPKRIEVGDLLTSTSDLLRRTLGETIEVTTSIKKVSDTIVDSGQLQNAILNLAINARDAMPKGGRLSIGVSDVELDEDYAAAYGDVRPGRYVMIAMTDSGTGMTKEIKDRAFEPFFTTKPQGSGTGLGLSSVYGFVKQSGGHVALYSEPGQGTTVRIYLPAASADKDESRTGPTGKGTMPRGKGQLVLVVEDDALVRRVTVSRLKSLGYGVIEASSGPSAAEMLHARADIRLLFTDMVMPGGMNGAELANLARASRPGLKILFTSGYAEADMMQEAKPSSETWLKKPYTAAELADRLHTILAD